MAKRQHKIKIFLSIVKIPCFCQKNSKNPEKLIVFQGFYSGQHFYPLNMVEVTGLEPTTSWSRTKRATKLRYTSLILFMCAAKLRHASIYIRQLYYYSKAHPFCQTINFIFGK